MPSKLSAAPAWLTLVVAVASSVSGAMQITYGPAACPVDPLGGGAPTSVIVYWRTDLSTADNTAYVSESPSGPWTYIGSDATDSTVHEALVEGLSPETRYYMYVDSAGETSPVLETRTGQNLLTGGSFETWHAVSESWGIEEPDGWHGWEIYPWTPPGANNPDHISISPDRTTGIPSPEQRHGSHRASMDEGWRSCYGGLYQEVGGLPQGDYIVSGWVAYLFMSTNPDNHRIEVLAKDGAHVPGAEPSGAEVLAVNSDSELDWIYVEGTVTCTSGTVTVYCNLRSDNYDGSSFAHFDGFRLMSEHQALIQFSNFGWSRSVSGGAYNVTLTYDTDVPATTEVEWGPTTSYGDTTGEDPGLVTEHSVELFGVAPAAQPYHWRAVGTVPPDVVEYTGDHTFDAPLLLFSNVSSVVDGRLGTVCTVGWQTNFPTTDNKVYYAEAGSGMYSEVPDPADPAPRTSHWVVLMDLSLDTDYEFYVSGGGSDLIPAASAVYDFTTPVEPGLSWRIGMAMIGGSIPDGGDDVGPANEVQEMIERQHPVVGIAGIPGTSWAAAQPDDPAGGPDVYDWSQIDDRVDDFIPGKSVLAYQQIWGTYPDWVELDTAYFWEKYEDFVEAMTIHINNTFDGPVYYTFENEPNIPRKPDGWTWDDWYTHCLAHFYVAVHRADAVTGKANKVIAGNLSGHSAGGFRPLYANTPCLSDISDILGYHAYPFDIRDGVEVDDLAEVHSIQEDYGDGDKQIWVSEGWGSGRSAGFDRSSPLIEPTAQEIENMFLAMVKGWDNVMTPQEHWHPDYLFGMKFFCGNDNWGAMNWRSRAIPHYDNGNIDGFTVDGYWMTPDIAPYFWNGGMMDFYGNSKDCLIHIFPGDGLVFMNPGFEIPSEPPNAHLPHFWEGLDDPAPEANYVLDDTIFHGGRRSLKLTQGSPAARGMSQMTVKRSVIPGLAYRARVWVRTQDVSALEASFVLRFCSLDGSVKSSDYVDLTSGSGDWRQLEIVASAPYYAERVEVGCYIDGVGTAWFDDVTISMEQQEETGTVRGYTCDEGQIIVPNCIVSTTTGGHQVVSDANGFFEMTDVPTGTYDFVCRQTGYVPFKVKNQTVAAGKLTFCSFYMGLPNPGLTVTDVSSDVPEVAVEGDPVTVTVTVDNDKPYPNMISDVNVYVEENGDDATGMFTVLASPLNARVIPAYAAEQFEFELSPKPGSQGRSFSVNAYAFGQEDRPNMLINGGFDEPDWDHHWSFSGGASQISWNPDLADYFSAPVSLRCYVAHDDDTFNWGPNWSAYGVSAMPAQPGRNYTVGVTHRDEVFGDIAVLVYIEEFYYDGVRWFYNGRRFTGLQHRDVWAEDVMIYMTGSPDINPGLYPTNRLLVSVGPHTPDNQDSYGTTWWDDVYLKETGDWLADDSADAGAPLDVTPLQSPAGVYHVGWNLTSVPVDPWDPDASSVFADLVALGNALDGNLYAYAPNPGYSVYSGDFSDVARGLGYWLRLTVADGATVVGVPGEVAAEPVELALAAGWNLIGHPQAASVPLADCLLTDGVEVKTLAEAAAAGWVQASLFRYNGGGYDMVKVSGGDDDSLRPWYGYWVLAYQAGLSLVVPAP